MTGNPKRPLKIPYHAKIRKGLPESIAFDSLTFPACAGCNSQFSNLETRVKGIVLKMLASGELASHEISTLLDWLDKVRTGLWLGELYLAGNPTGIKPKFHISARLSAKDRMVVIHRCEEGPTGLGYYGTMLPIFWYHPVCFSLIINHLSFLNASTDFLFSRRLGFPYPETMTPTPDGYAVAEMAGGMERYISPLIRTPYEQNGTEMFQPMFHHSLSPGGREQWNGLYETEYVRRHSMSYSDGVGKIILQRERAIAFYPENPSKQWLPVKQYKLEELLRFVPIQTLRLQNDLIDAGPLTKSQKQKFSRLKNLNRQAIKVMRKADILSWEAVLHQRHQAGNLP